MFALPYHLDQKGELAFYGKSIKNMSFFTFPFKLIDPYARAYGGPFLSQAYQKSLLIVRRKEGKFGVNPKCQTKA
jgi:hypothetical protein